ncbi:hypothetical protein VTK73DRAFT_6605 [Phialemonium thermophilum]|uniref:C2H2-type domain-containing protein n=1 Tax=Phialemonium thermophilum TaxID=223376 RepID=A0ABR3WIZ2_9PEZI
MVAPGTHFIPAVTTTAKFPHPAVTPGNHFVTGSPTSLEECGGQPGSTARPFAPARPFTPGECLFCPQRLPSFDASVLHMQKSHGFCVPYSQHLIIDLETLFRYLHLVIFEYHECIQCGKTRSTALAIRQHMVAKDHCHFDVVEPDSEFADFYDFSSLDDGENSGCEEYCGNGEEPYATKTTAHFDAFDGEDSIRLPSGKIISRKSAAGAGPPFLRTRPHCCNVTSRQRRELAKPSDGKVEEPIQNELGKCSPRSLSKRQRRDKAIGPSQLASLRASDQHSLAHLPGSQQRAILAAQRRHAEKRQYEKGRRQSKLDRKGNKNLYAYWATETPVYLCG